jgi:hypothetical protein
VPEQVEVTSARLRYRRLIHRLRGTVDACTPAGADILVISKGDDELICFNGRRGGHFPGTPEGSYLGHHPADSKEALELLEEQIRHGATYLLIPSTASWWLEHYREFGDYLCGHHKKLVDHPDACVLFELRNGASG